MQLLNILGLLASVVMNAWMFVSMRSDKRWASVSEEMAAARRQYVDLDKRVTVLEGRVEDLPDHDDLTAMREQLGAIKSSVAALDERTESTLVGVRRIEQYLLEKGR